MSLSQTLVLRLYNSVIEDVISGVRDTFLDDGVDEQVLQELKQLWESKLLASKAVEQVNETSDHQPPVVTKANGNKIDNATNAPTTTNSTTTTSQPANTTNQQMIPSLSSLDPNNKVPVQLTLPAQVGVPGSTSRIFTLQIPASALQNNQLHQVLTGPVITATMTLPHHLAATLLQQHINAALSGQQTNFTNITTTANQVKSQLDGADDSCDDDHYEILNFSHNNDSNMECERISLPQENSEKDDPCQGCSNSSTSNNLDSILERQLINKSRGNSKSCKLRNKRPTVIKFVMDGADDTSDDDMSDPGGAGASDDDVDGGSGVGSDGGPGDDEDGEEGEEGGAEEEPLNSEDDVSEEDPFDMFDTDNVVVCQYDKISRSRNKWKFYLKDGIMNLSGKDFVFQKANGDAEW